MRRDVHLAALGAAARVAFGLAFAATACKSAQPSSAETNARSPGEGGTHADTQAPSTPPAVTPKSPAPSCDEVIASGFPGVDPNEYVTERRSDASPALERCCTERLRVNGAQAPYRFHCCSVVDYSSKSLEDRNTIGAACTPWGPPAPPSMPSDFVASAPRAMSTDVA